MRGQSRGPTQRAEALSGEPGALVTSPLPAAGPLPSPCGPAGHTAPPDTRVPPCGTPASRTGRQPVLGQRPGLGQRPSLGHLAAPPQTRQGRALPDPSRFSHMIQSPTASQSGSQTWCLWRGPPCAVAPPALVGTPARAGRGSLLQVLLHPADPSREGAISIFQGYQTLIFRVPDTTWGAPAFRMRSQTVA